MAYIVGGVVACLIVSIVVFGLMMLAMGAMIAFAALMFIAVVLMIFPVVIFTFVIAPVVTFFRISGWGYRKLASWRGGR